MSIQDELERFTEDAKYFDRHRQELLEQYPEHWVAVYNQQVVGAATDIKRLISKVQEQGIRPGEVYREYLTTDETLLILVAIPA